jgi:hypothetical protein
MAQITLNSSGVASNGSLVLQSNGTTTAVTVDTAQNVGVGATPSAWGSTAKAVQLPSGCAIARLGDGDVVVTQNAYFDNPNFKYASTTGVGSSVYRQIDGAHRWSYAASGTAGNNITFTEAMRIDTSGNVGIGTSSPTGKLTVSKAGAEGIEFIPGGTSNVSTTQYYNRSGAAYTANSQDASYHSWLISGAEKARIDSSGNLLVGGTAATNAAKVESFFNGATQNGIVANDTASASGTTFFMCSLNGTNIGTIGRVGATSSVIYNTTSDQRLKSNIEDAAPVLEKLMGVPVRQYDWTEGDLHQDYGFVAQEIEPLLSGVVTKGKEDEDMWQMDYSRLTPHLVKAIQEMKAIIDTQASTITQLQADVAALKGASA